jgi:hypothetical protein
MKSSWLILAAALLFGACDSKPKIAPYDVVIKNSGVNMLDSASLYKDAEQLFLGFDVEGYSSMSELGIERVKIVSLGDEEFLIIYPDSKMEKISKISTRNKKVKTKHRIGSAYNRELFTCTEDNNTTTCNDSSEPNITYVISDDKISEAILRF